MTVFHEGLSDKAPGYIKEAARLRAEGLALVDNAAPLPTEYVILCAQQLKEAFKGCAYNRYSPEFKPPAILGIAALQTALCQFEEFPRPEESTKIDPFNRNAYQLLSDWAVDVSKMPEWKTLNDTERKAISSSVQTLGISTLLAVEKFGEDAIDGVPTRGFSTDPNASPNDANVPTRIDQCLAAICLSCGLGAFAKSNSIPIDEWNELSNAGIDAYNDILERSDEISEEREGITSAGPSKVKGRDTTRPAKIPQPIPQPQPSTPGR